MGKTKVMSYKIKNAKQIVILFIVLPLALLITALAFIAIKQNMFEKRYYYTTLLQDANGISTQTQVLFKGFDVGRISGFELTPEGIIKARFYVLKRFHHIMVNESVIYRITNPLTGKTTLEYFRAPGSISALADEAEVLSTDFAEGRALFRKISPQSSDMISSIIENINILTGELNRDGNEDRGALFRILKNVADLTERTQESMNRIDAILAEIVVFSRNINRDGTSDQGTVFRLLNSVADISEEVNRQMVQVDSLVRSATVVTRNLENPDSLLVRMLDPTGEVLIQPIQKTIQGLSVNLEQTHELLSLVNRNNPEILMLITNMNETLSNAKKTLEALNNNPILRKGITPTAPKQSSPPSRITEPLKGD